MAEEQSHAVDAVAVPEIKDEAAPVAAEETPATETAAAAAPAADAEDKPAEDDKPAETAEETGAAKEEVKPIEEGFLSHKAQGSGFPKNLFPSKTYFYVRSDALEAEALAVYKKAEKNIETAHHNIAWAAHSPMGLLFVGDKKAPSNIINMSDAGDVEVDGNKGFFFTAKGHKHTFKAASKAERDGWVNLLKEKIVEAKELAATVTETEAYKQTMESFRPATPAAKEDKPEETTEDASKADAPKEDAAKEEDAARDELKVDEPKEKPRSASRKRASFFGFGKKEDKEEAKEEEPITSSEAPVIDTVPETEAPATEDAPAAEPAAEDKPAEEVQPDSPKEKVNKRLSIFAGVFSKKEKKPVEPVKTEEAPKEEAETTDSAPVIPPVQATDPLAVDVSSPVAAPTETVESPVAASEPKKDIKEKRKSSLPFGLGKRDKSPAPPSESTFSKLRATIKGKGASKAEEKSGEEAGKEDEPANEGEPETIKEEGDADATAADATTEEAPKIEDAEPSKEDAPAAPAVTASA